MDVKSDSEYMKSWAVSRVNDTTLTPVGVFIFNTLGFEQQEFFSQFKIPCIISSFNPNAYTQNLDQGPAYRYAYFIEPAVQYYFRELASKYVELGVKTLAAVVDLGDYIVNPNIDWSYSRDSCVLTAKEIMEPLGIELLGQFTYYIQTATHEDYVEIVKEMKDLNPDAVMICDIVLPTGYPDLASTWILKLMKEMDYLPKAVNVQDIAGSAIEAMYVPDGTLDYVTQVTFTHPDLNGIDFTEDYAPYSSTFTQGNVTTVGDGLIAGSNLPDHPSSARLFYRWYKEQLGYYPPYLAVGIWAAFDVVESAVWHAGMSASMRADSILDGSEVMDMLSMTNAATPYGRVIFDYNRINTKSYASVVQWKQASFNTSIVAPGNLANDQFVYPMPHWKERTYVWSLMKGNTGIVSIVAGIMSIVLLALMATVVIYRQHKDVKMLHAGHLVALLSMSLLIIWSLVFVWQGDVKQIQCDCYLWTIYLPISFIIQLVNMKAYRLSVFLTSDSKTRLMKLTHSRIMLLTLGWVSFTAILLMIAQIVDPPIAKRTIVDELRPSQDYYSCTTGATSSSILYFLFVFHILMSTFCVIIVRNGSEAFKDGLLMKESFIILFSCITVAFIFSQLGLSPHSFYLLRTLSLSLGITAFCLRLLLGRCLRHWIPNDVAKVLIQYYKKFESLKSQYLSTTTAKVTAMEIFDAQADGDFPMTEAPLFTDLDEMQQVLCDENRGPLFREIAQRALIFENVAFLDALNELPERYSNSFVTSSHTLPKEVVTVARDIFDKFCESGSELEVNISDKTRNTIRERLKTISQRQEPYMSHTVAHSILREDLMGLGSLMEEASSEIRVILYQNIWCKFKAAETELKMSADLNASV